MLNSLASIAICLFSYNVTSLVLGVKEHYIQYMKDRYDKLLAIMSADTFPKPIVSPLYKRKFDLPVLSSYKGDFTEVTMLMYTLLVPTYF